MQLLYNNEIVYENVMIAHGIYEMTVKGNFSGTPGQFYMLRCWDKEPILSRPISIHRLNNESISFLYAAVGEGTSLLSKLKKGDNIRLMGPLGDNGFPVNDIKGKTAIITGGAGIAPMLYCAEKLRCSRLDIYAGFKDEVYSVQNFIPFADNIYLSTESGKDGHKGYITDIFKAQNYDTVLCCGPEPMMKKVLKMCFEKSVKVYVSMEKHMACGIGACLVCTCKTNNGNKRTCKDGPVFSGDEIYSAEIFETL